MYIITFGISLVFIYMSEKIKYCKQLFIILGLLVPSILAGVRDYSVGTDVLLYGNSWFERAVQIDSLSNYLSKANEYGVGLGYAFINFIISRFTNNAHVFYFLYELLQLTILYYVLKRYQDKISITFAFAIYYFCYFNISLNLLRQIMAVLLVLYSYRYVEDKKIIKFIVTIFIATLVHNSAIVGIVLFPIKVAVDNKQWKKIFKILVIGSCLLAVFLYEQIFNLLSSYGINGVERYAHYMTDTEVGGRFVRLFYWGILLIIILLKRKKCELYYKEFEFLQLLMLISTVGSLFMFIGSTWIIRIVYYFDIFQIIYMPILAHNMEIVYGPGRKKVGYFILMLLVIVNWLITFVIRNGGATYPFVFMK